MNRFDFSLIVPVLDERDNIEALLSRVEAACEQAGLSPEILIADGGSRDGTAEFIRQHYSGNSVRLIQPEGPGDLATDVLAAAREACCEVVAVMDADFSHPPESLPDLVLPVLRGECGINVGSRYCRGGRISDWPWWRRLLSRSGTLAAVPLAGVSDPLSGFFALPRDAMLRLGGEVQGFKLLLEILARNDNLRVQEMPIHFQDRSLGYSKLDWRESVKALGQVMSLAGASVSQGSAWRFAVVGLLGFVVDWCVFRGMATAGMGVHSAYTSAFVVATLFNYALNSRWSFNNLAECGWRAEASVYGRYLLTCVLALILRHTVFSSLVNNAGWSIDFAAIAGIVAGAGVTYIGAAFFVFPQTNPRTGPELRWRALALAFIGYSLALRLFAAGGIDLIPEEAYYWNYAQNLAPGYLDHPPMIAWLIAASTAVLGDNELAVRLGSLLCWIVAAGFIFALARRMYSLVAAIFAVMLVATLPGFFGFGLLATPDAPLFAAWAAALYYFYLALVESEERAWLGVGLAMGLGMLSKYTIALLGPAALAFVLLDARARRWLTRPSPYVAVLVALIVFSPVLYWNATHDWASFTFQGMRRMQNEAEFGLGSLVESVLILLTPMIAVAVAALAWPGRAADPRRRFAWCFAAIPLSVFVVYSFQNETKLNWTGPLWLALMPLLGAAIGVHGVHRFAGVARNTWRSAAVFSFLLWGALFSASNVGWAPEQDLHLPVAWEEFVASVGALEDTQTPGAREFVIVGMDKYFIASQYAFYDPDGDGPTEVSSQHLFGSPGRMWQWWAPAERMVGNDLLLVALDRDDLHADKVASYFRELGPIRSRAVTKNGRTAARYYYRIGRSYQGIGKKISKAGTANPSRQTGSAADPPQQGTAAAHFRPR